VQLSLLGHEQPRLASGFVAAVRHDLTLGAWLEHMPGFVASGQAALFASLEAGLPWQQTEQVLYDRTVQTPRLVAQLDDAESRWPIVREMAELLSSRYDTRFERISFALYRDGHDSVAFHRDRVLRNRQHGLVATVSLGGPRSFHLRPHLDHGSTLRFQLGLGDLMVMGGTCQRTWEHAIPKTKRVVSPRIAIMFRPV
jgi:alkylated DNA repair dioxygenase AlkB